MGLELTPARRDKELVAGRDSKEAAVNKCTFVSLAEERLPSVVTPGASSLGCHCSWRSDALTLSSSTLIIS